MSRDRELARERTSEDAPPRATRDAKSPVLELQRTVGNRAVGRLLARKAAAPQQPTVKIGRWSIVVGGGNIAAWAANEVPDTLDVTSEKGKHSAELEKMSKEKTRIKSLTLTVAPRNKSTGEHLDAGSLAIEITNARIKGYVVDGTTESWHVADFDGVHRTTTSRKVLPK